MPASEPTPAPSLPLEFPMSEGVGLDVNVRRAHLTLATHREHTARIVFPQGGAEAFTAEMTDTQLRVGQRPPGLLARMVTHKHSEACEVHIVLPEHTCTTVTMVEGSLLVAATLGKSSFTLTRGIITYHRSFAPAVITIDEGSANLGFIAAPLRLNMRRGTIALDQVHAPAQVSTGTANLTVNDMHATLDVIADTSTVTVHRAHEGIFELASSASTARIGVMPDTPIVTEVSGFSPVINSALHAREPLPGEPHVRVRAGGMQPVIELHPVGKN